MIQPKTWYPPTVTNPATPPRQPFVRPWFYDESLVLWWTTEMTASWRDYSRSGYTGTVSGATIVETGRFGQAYSFDGNNDYIEIVASPACNIKTTKRNTYCCWFKTNNVTEIQYIMYGIAGGGNGFNYFLILVGGAIRNRLSDGVGSAESVTAAITANQWVFYCATIDLEGRMYGFINGVVSGTNNDATTEAAADQRTWRVANDADSLNGICDECMVFNRVLSNAEIYALYLMGKPS